MAKYSFSIGGFWFHLQKKHSTVYLDQHGSEWYKSGNKMYSSGGNYEWDIPVPPAKKVDNKDFHQYERQTRFNHIPQTKDGYAMNRFQYIHS